MAANIHAENPVRNPIVEPFHKMLPSAFTIAETPLHYCWKAFEKSAKCWHQETQTRQENFKNKVFSVGFGMIGILSVDFVGLPIALCLTPITILADIIVGIVEVAFSLYHYQKLTSGELATLAKKKLLIFPLQQLLFSVFPANFYIITLAALTHSIAFLAFPVFLSPLVMLWNQNMLEDLFGEQTILREDSNYENYNYCSPLCPALVLLITKAADDLLDYVFPARSKEEIDRLLREDEVFWRETLNIPENVIEQLRPIYRKMMAARDYSENRREANRQFYAIYDIYNDAYWKKIFNEDFQHNPEIRAFDPNRWASDLNQYILSIVNKGNSEGVSEEYNRFKQCVLRKCSPRDLLELQEGFSEALLKKQHRKFWMALHPDRNPALVAESTILFKILESAYCMLSSN